MAKFSITMPDEMKVYILKAMKAQQFENTSEYFRYLVRQDQERENKIVERRKGLDKDEFTGSERRSIKDIWQDAERQRS
jgi:Arc/MetJ-type ribon-helix-helix transcriptional regulator